MTLHVHTASECWFLHTSQTLDSSINMRQDWAPVSDWGLSVSSLKIHCCWSRPCTISVNELWMLCYTSCLCCAFQGSGVSCLRLFVTFTWADEIRRGRFGSSLRNVNISSFILKNPSIHSIHSVFPVAPMLWFACTNWFLSSPEIQYTRHKHYINKAAVWLVPGFCCVSMAWCGGGLYFMVWKKTGSINITCVQSQPSCKEHWIDPFLGVHTLRLEKHTHTHTWREKCQAGSIGTDVLRNNLCLLLIYTVCV